MAIRAFSIIFISLLLTSGLSYCQSNSTKAFQVRIAPLNLFDPMTGTVQVGVQKRFNKRLALSLDYGLQFDKLSLSSPGSVRKDYKYHKYKAEVKYYFKTTSSSDNQYMSLQGFYFPQHYRKDNSWLVRNGKSYYFDHSDIDRKVVVLSCLAGGEHIKGRWVFNYYFGVGIRKLIIRHQPTNPVEGRRPTSKEWFDFSPIDVYEGNFYRPHLANGFKIGYILNK